MRDRLASELRRYLVSTSRLEWGPSQANALFAQWAQQWLSPFLWCPPSHASAGLALAQTKAGGVRIHGLWLDPPGPASLEAFLRDADSSTLGPVAVLTDVLADIRDDEQDAILRPKGFWHREKVRLRRGGDLSAPPPIAEARMRPIRLGDLEGLVTLYARAYRERPGEFWIAEAADPEADARENMGSFLESRERWAPSFLPAASRVWDEDGRIQAAILVEARGADGAYIADVMVDPSRQRRGIGRRLLEGALAELAGGGRPTVELAAYRYGAPYRLYRSLGFREIPPPDGRLDGQWVRGADPVGPREPLG